MVPDELLKLLDEWRGAGCPEQPGISWPRERWAVSHPSARDLFGELPIRLSRPAVRQVCATAANTPAEAERAFLAVMAWGFGRVGYGPYRTRRILDRTSQSTLTLQRAAQVAASGNAVGAYSILGDHGVASLPGLGPAFGTKYLYFCSSAGRTGAVILDRLMARWLALHAGIRLNQVRWSSRTYGRYLSVISEWASELNVAGDVIESVIFQHQARLANSQWG